MNRFLKLRTESGISDIDTRYQILFDENTSGLSTVEKETVKIIWPKVNLDDVPAFSNMRHCRLVANMYRCFSPANRAEAELWVNDVSGIIDKLQISDVLKEYAAKLGRQLLDTFEVPAETQQQSTSTKGTTNKSVSPIGEELRQYVEAVNNPSQHNYVTWEDRLDKAETQKTIAQK